MFQTELERPCVGRLRCIFPDGSLCSAWIDLDFVPGETYHITVHNGYYDEDRDYERRVGRQSGRSLIGSAAVVADTVVVADDVPDEYQPAIIAPRLDWRSSLSPEHQAKLELRSELVQMYIETIKASYKSIGEELKGTRDQYKMDRIFDEIIKQNKELDKRYQDVIKQVKDLHIPATEISKLYKEILTFYNEQNRAISEITKNYGAYTKSSRKAQKQVTELMEKYVNDMIKALE